MPPIPNMTRAKARKFDDRYDGYFVELTRDSETNVSHTPDNLTFRGLVAIIEHHFDVCGAMFIGSHGHATLSFVVFGAVWNIPTIDRHGIETPGFWAKAEEVYSW